MALSGPAHWLLAAESRRIRIAEVPSLVRTTRFSRGRLPHWEVEHCRYFVTVRCHDSLPPGVVAQLGEIHASLSRVEARSEAFARLQRRYFLTMEKYLDAGRCGSLLASREAAETLLQALVGLAKEGVLVPHYSIMPNHWHALFTPLDGRSFDLHSVMTRLKGRSSRAINARLNRTGSLWQREWFDRWMRSDTEWDRCAE